MPQHDVRNDDRSGDQSDGHGGDVAIDATTALLYSPEAPLVPAPGAKDARAVWARVPPDADRSALVYLHGHDNYVTVDANGRSRVPDWAAGDPAAKAGAAGKPAAPLAYRLDTLENRTARRPVILVPEVATLTTGSFWAHEPAGQYADPRRLDKLVGDCLNRLSRLQTPANGGRPYLRFSTDPFRLTRVCVAGHSGAGLPLEQAATSALLTSGRVPADLWLLDCTYWSRVDGFVEFCRRWQRAGRLEGAGARTARFVCVYRPKTQTEAVADALRGEIAKLLNRAPDGLVADHASPSGFEDQVKPLLRGPGGVAFVRTYLPHDEIPTFFLPALLETAGS